MPTSAIVLTWNPKKWSPSPVDDARFIEACNGDTSVLPFLDKWSVGNRKHIDIGTKFFLLRQGRERGILASGTVTSAIQTGPHWDGSGRESRFVDIEFQQFVAVEHRLRTEELVIAVPKFPWNYLQMSGLELKDDYFADLPGANWHFLREIWLKHVSS